MKSEQSNLDLVFDDEPIEAILYGNPAPGPSPASLFDECEASIDEIHTAMEQGNTPYALRLMEALFESKAPLPVDILMVGVGLLGGLIEDYPCPLVEAHGVDCERILRPCFEAGLKKHNDRLMDRAVTPLYRWYEAVKRYSEAGEVLKILLKKVRKDRNPTREGILTNNLGYEHLLAEQWEEAEPYFQKAILLFKRADDSEETANARANGFICEAGKRGIEHLIPKQAELVELACAMRRHRDWKARKPLRLLAQIQECQGNLSRAVVYARRAVKAGEGIPSRHTIEDQEYLMALQGKS